MWHLILASWGTKGSIPFVQNYAGVMGIIELYAMGATFLIALVKWVDWVW